MMKNTFVEVRPGLSYQEICEISKQLDHLGQITEAAMRRTLTDAKVFHWHPGISPPQLTG